MEPFSFKFLSLLPSPDVKVPHSRAVSKSSLLGHKHNRFGDSICPPGTHGGHREDIQASNQTTVLAVSERGSKSVFYYFMFVISSFIGSVNLLDCKLPEGRDVFPS